MRVTRREIVRRFIAGESAKRLARALGKTRGHARAWVSDLADVEEAIRRALNKRSGRRP